MILPDQTGRQCKNQHCTFSDVAIRNNPVSQWAQNYSCKPRCCVNSAKTSTESGLLLEYMNGQTQAEPESCVLHRVWKAARECECACTSWCVQGKTDEKWKVRS